MTIREMMLSALQPDDRPEDVRCVWHQPTNSWDTSDVTLHQCLASELPQREFDDGFGGENGEHVIGFSTCYVYVKHVYDGAESIVAVPRTVTAALAEGRIESVGG